MKNFRLLIYMLVFAITSCNYSQSNSEGQEYLHELEELYATPHFTIYKGDYFFVLEVSSIYQNFDGSERYVFYLKENKPPELSNITHFFSTPVESISISSTTHLGFLNELGVSGTIVGAKDLKYAYDKEFLNRLESGFIEDLGLQQYNVEKLLELSESVNLAYAIDGSTYKEVLQLRAKGERFILISEFMEQDPIAKAKWMLPIAMLFGEKKMMEAIDYLEKLEVRYEELKSKVANLEQKPTVMIGLPWRGSWFVSGGDSFQARFIADAGGNYIWSDIVAKASVPISMEKVFIDAIDADFWVNPGATNSIQEILERDERFKNLKPMNTKQIYNQNKRLTKNDGNDYWESAVVHPDLVLADLIAIFHSEKLPNHDFTYYQKLKP